MESPTTRSERAADHHAGHGHGVRHMLLHCGLMLGAILLLPILGSAWGTWLVIAALVLCPLTMVVMMRVGSPRRWLTARRNLRYETRARS